MEGYSNGERAASDRLHARCVGVLKALERTKLSEFTVGQLRDLMQLVDDEPTDESLARKRGMKVRYKNAPRNKRGLGEVTSHPHKGSRIVHVRGPRGWAGWSRVDELEIVRAPDPTVKGGTT